VFLSCQVCPRGERANLQKVCERCTESPELYDWLYLDSWPCCLWYCTGSSLSGILERRGQQQRQLQCSAPHITAMLECSVSVVVTLLVTEPVASSIYGRVESDAVRLVHTMLITPAQTTSTPSTAPRRLSTHYSCGLGKSDRFKSIYAALYFFPILTVLQAVGGGLLFLKPGAKKKRLVVLFSHWLLHAYGIISISPLDKLAQDLPLLASCLVPPCSHCHSKVSPNPAASFCWWQRTLS
ncbi:hypothetical protein INR49_006351, partial [Caranx melampygus]